MKGCAHSVKELNINNMKVARQKTRGEVEKRKRYLLCLREGVLTVEYEILDIARADIGGPAGSR